MTLVATITIGTPVTLLMIGTVLLARGFTSRTYTEEVPSSLSMMTYWMFINPLTCSASPMRTE